MTTHSKLTAELDANNCRLYIRAPDGQPIYAEMFEALTNMTVFTDGVLVRYFYDETVYPDEEMGYEDGNTTKIRQRHHCELRVVVTSSEPSTDAPA